MNIQAVYMKMVCGFHRTYIEKSLRGQTQRDGDSSFGTKRKVRESINVDLATCFYIFDD